MAINPYPLSDELEEETRDNLVKFWEKNRQAVEYTKTFLFCINMQCKEAQGTAKKSDLEEVWGCFEDVKDKLLDLLWKFLASWQYKERLVVTSDWLAAYFGARLLDSNCPRVYQDESKNSPERILSFWKEFSLFMLYLIHSMRTFGNVKRLRFSEGTCEEVINAEIFLLSEFTHIEAGLSRQIHLFDILRQMWTSEAILYTVRNTYREHLHHAIDCSLLGTMLMDVQINGKSFYKALNKSETSADKASFLRNWLLAGLTHDTGFIIDLCQQAVKHIDFLCSSPQISNFRAKICQDLKEAEGGLRAEINKSLRTKEKMDKELDHGVIAAYYLYYLLKDRASEDNLIEELQPAIVAIAKHNLPKETIDATNEPLSFLLLLCDHLQEWDRPRVNVERFRHSVVTGLVRPERREFEKTTCLRHMRTNFMIDSKDRLIETVGDEMSFDLQYKDAGEEGFEPSLIWANSSCDFQKIKKDSLDVPVKIEMSHSLALKLQKPIPLTEMNLFEEFVFKEKAGVPIIPWIEAVRNNTNGVKYQYDEDGIEKLTIDLREIAEESLIIELPPELYELYTDWKIDRLQKVKLRSRVGY